MNTHGLQAISDMLVVQGMNLLRIACAGDRNLLQEKADECPLVPATKTSRVIDKFHEHRQI